MFGTLKSYLVRVFTDPLGLHAADASTKGSVTSAEAGKMVLSGVIGLLTWAAAHVAGLETFGPLGASVAASAPLLLQVYRLFSQGMPAPQLFFDGQGMGYVVPVPGMPDRQAIFRPTHILDPAQPAPLSPPKPLAIVPGTEAEPGHA